MYSLFCSETTNIIIINIRYSEFSATEIKTNIKHEKTHNVGFLGFK